GGSPATISSGFPCSWALFQRWNNTVSSRSSASSTASPPLSANQRAKSDLPERGGPVSTAVRKGHEFGRLSASATCALAVPITIRDGPLEPGANGSAICDMPAQRASARDGERVAADGD